MIKKLVLIFAAILSLITIAACSEDEALKLPDLEGKSKQEVVNIFSGLGIVGTFEDVPNVDIQEGYFVSYGSGFEVDQVVEPGAQVTVNFALFANILPDLEGMTQSQIYSSFTKFPSLIVEIQSIETNDVEAGLFVEYGSNLNAGDIVNNNTVVIVYIATEEPDTGLFISKYFEGSDNSKMVELYNATDEAIDLTDYNLTIFNRVAGQTVTTSVPLTGSIAALSTYIIANPESKADMLLLADMESADLVYTGRQTIAITHKGGRHVDMFGDPTSGLLFANERTFVRHQIVEEANDTFDIKEWGIYALDNYEMFGSHPVAYPEFFVFDPAFLLLDYYTQPSGVVKVDFISNNDGDTAQFQPGFMVNDRVRFVGIDTPETGSGQIATDATNFVYNLLNNATNVYIQQDPASGIKDTYDRYLGLIWADDYLVNYEVVKYGYSQNNYSDDQQRIVLNGVSLHQWFLNAEEYAKENKLGMWR